MDKSIVELAVMIKNGGANNPKESLKSTQKPYEGFLIGKVLVPPPEIQIEVSPEILLDKSELLFSAHLLNNYEREFEIYDAEIQFTDENCGTTNVTSAHSHSVESLSIDSQTLTAKGKIKWTDTIKKDDMVILVPAGNAQMYVVIDKAVEL